MRLNRNILLSVFACLLIFACSKPEPALAKPDLATKEATALPELQAKCGGIFGLCGYIDKETGEEIIQQAYQKAFPFHEGLAGVRLNGKYGYINRQGEMVIPPRFDLVGTFNRGLAEVVVGDKAGVIDRSGNYHVEPQFARAIPFTEGTAIAVEGTWRRGRREGFEARELQGLHDGSLGFIAIELKGGAGLYHPDKGWLTSPRLRISALDRAASGLIWAAETDNPRYDRNLRYGLMRADGTWHLAPAFSYVSYTEKLDNDFIVVGAKVGRSRRGAITIDGEIVVPFIYDDVRVGREGYNSVHVDGKVGVINRKGELIVDRFFDRAEMPHYPGAMPLVRDGDTWMALAPNGRLSTSTKDLIVTQCEAGLSVAHADGDNYYVMKSNGSLVSEDTFTGEWILSELCDRPLTGERNGEYVIITQSGRRVPETGGFENLVFFRNGGAWVQKDGFWGRINLEGDTIIPFQYRNLVRPLKYNNQGYVVVSLDNDTFLINESGQKVVPDDAGEKWPKDWLLCSGGARLFHVGDKWGLRGASDEILIEPVHAALTCFRSGISWVPTDEEGAWCPIGPDGNRAKEPACQTTRYPFYQSHHTPEKLDPDPYRSSVLWHRLHLDWANGMRSDPPKMIGDGIQSGLSSTIQRR